MDDLTRKDRRTVGMDFKNVESQLGSFLAACCALIFAIHRAQKPEGLDCCDAPLRSAAGDDVEGSPRDGKPREKIFTMVGR